MESIIVSFANRKGGSGKSTLAVLTATALHKRTGKKILLLDCDSQKTVYDQYQQDKTENPQATTYDVDFFNWNNSRASELFPQLIEKAQDQYDYIFLDVPGKQEGEEIRLSLLFSDYVIVPIVARPSDAKSTIKFLESIKPMLAEKKKKGYETTIFGVPNRLDRTRETSQIKEFDGLHGLRLFENGLSEKVKYFRELSTFEEIENGKDDEFNRYFNEFATKVK